MNIDEEGNELWSHVYDDLTRISIGNAGNRTNDGGLIICVVQNINKTDPNRVKLLIIPAIKIDIQIFIYFLIY